MNARTAGTDRRIPAVLTDFDDTAAAQNVAELLLHEFGHPTWTEVRERFRAGELSLKDYQEATFLRMQADKDAMQSYVQANANLRPHFGELSDFCQANSVPMCIISQGLDFYIQALLDACGQPEIPVFAVATDFDQRGRVSGYRYDFAYPDAPHLGNSKALIVRRFQEQGHHVFFMGDGRSDFEAGEVADTVFAHRQMAAMCDEAGIEFVTFTDFGPVLEALQRYMAVLNGG
ncbi:MAG: MtnX-like HAD-IB family phosphatase [Chloroflexota bacterium]|nr:MtnX-like HAD-IB family phosphatase [Chloroflexota bacterium]MDE2961937.1 MtnX-like HAD-IB family phosphatase [Chloroflexota bacterium]